jgi:N6-adenosine-specific RNA methylase IME4
MPDRYDVILADPPWVYDDKAHSGERGVQYKYDVMTPGQIKGLPVDTISKPDSVLFLWTTMPQLLVAVDVMKAWGFTYKTVAFVWVKRTKHGKLAWGMGNWTRANPEMVLLGVRGKPKRVSRSVLSVVEAERREHSRKPDEVRQQIVRLMGPEVDYVELFARPPVPEGWDVWGNEVECSFEFPTAASRLAVLKNAGSPQGSGNVPEV